MKVVYHGIFDEVLVPDISATPIKRGTPIDVPDDVGKRLLEQEENWQLSGRKVLRDESPPKDDNGN
jgi:hypothetical protein